MGKRSLTMYLSKFLVIAWIMVTTVTLYLSIRHNARVKRKNRRIRNLERTIEKLKLTNGKLWYDVRKKERTEAYDLSELTQTNL
jgi:hypothetical protein